MKKATRFLFVFLLLLSNLISAQQPFSVINDVPHLALRAPDAVVDPEIGMLIYSTIADKPLVYTGAVWEDLCTNRIGNGSTNEYFTVKNGISYLAVLRDNPANSDKAGTIYYSSVKQSAMINNGTGWIKIRDIGNSTFTESKGFSAGIDVKTFKLPVLQNNPPTAGLAKGAFYINSLSRSIRYYNGLVWKDLNCTDLPSIITLPLSNITSMTAISGGDITADGGSPITARGIRWSVKGDPIDDQDAILTNDGSGVGTFPSSLTGLLGNTTYYVRAYAVNSQGTAYGNLLQFTTAPPGLPVLSFATLKITDITEKSAQGVVNILNNGGALVSERGFTWSTDKINWFIGKSTDINKTDIGIFSANLVGLLPGTTYYAKGYATNSVGTIFTSETSFVTNSAPFIVTIKPVNVTGNEAYSGGHINNNGGSGITLRGICWSTEELPTIALNTKTEEPVSGDGVGSFSSKLSGLSPATKYYVRAYAVNDAGLTYGKQETFTTPDYATVLTLSAGAFFNNTTIVAGQVLADGGAPVTSRGICWGTTENPDVNGAFSSAGAGTGVFSSKLTQLLPHVTYHTRAYATNNVGTVYGADKTFIMIPEIPEVSTLAPFAMTNISATAGGNVTSSGGADITARGIRWSIKGDPMDDTSAGLTENGSGTGSYESVLNGLMGNTSYYLRAYATNKFGTAYGELLEFKTLAAQVPVLASSTLNITDITYTEASGSIHILNNGGAAVVSRGIRYGTDKLNYLSQESLSQNPTDLGSYLTNLKNLLPGTMYYAKGFATNSAGTIYTTETSFTTPLQLSLTTTPVTQVTNNYAESGGHILSSGMQGITFTGICWSSSPNPTIADDYISGPVSNTFISKMGGLLGNTKYYVRAYAGNSATLVYGNEQSFVTASSGLATVTTVDITNLQSSKATVKGNVMGNGGSLLTERGICWSTRADPTIADQYLADGDDLGEFLLTLTGLSAETKYYVRAYAINGVGISYGEELVFSTKATPTTATLKTLTANEITAFSANSGGEITNDGGSAISGRGICWNTSGLPTTADQLTNGGAGTGNYVQTMTGLKGNTSYYIRAYATNESGISYGQIVQFTTAPPVLASLTTKPASTGAQGITALSGGIVSNDGGAAVTAGGLVWSTTAGFNPDTVSSKNHLRMEGIADNFNITMTGLKPGTIYYVRAFAVNSVGTAYATNEAYFTTFNKPFITTSSIENISNSGATAGGNIRDNGGTAVEASGVCWSTGNNPDLADEQTTSSVGTGNFSHQIKGLLANTTYYVRAYATNSVGTAYGAVQTFLTLPPTLATLTTTQAIATSGTTGSSGGVIEDNGGAAVTTRGIYWSTQPNFNPDTVSLNKTTENGTFSNGNFAALLSGLNHYTVYYVRAYAKNSVGFAYGNLVSFISPKLPELSTLNTSAIGSTSAISGGDITDDGAAAITERGVVWGLKADFNPDAELLNRTHNGTGTGVFNATLPKLKPATNYYIRAYATNVAGTNYGNLLTFLTNPPVLATLSTKAVVNITGSTASSGGILFDDGGAELISAGMVWSTTSGFRPDTVQQNKTTQIATGNFNSVLNSLLPGKTYYFRAWVSNSVGVAYGNELSFTTLNSPTLTSTEISVSSTGTMATGGGTILNDGGAVLTNQGLVWSTTANPSLLSPMKTAYDPRSGNTFRSILRGLEPATLYYAKAYAINSQGTGYGNEVTFTTPPALPTITTNYLAASSKSSATTGGDILKDGGAAILARGVIWSKDRNFNPDTVQVNKTANGAGSGIFTAEITNLALSTAYYVRAYAQNSVGIAYGNQVSITLFPTAPILNTTEITELGGFTANAGGEFTSDGGADIARKGLCWSLNTNPTINDYSTVNGSGMDAFTATMTNLLPNTLYYVRAYGLNKIGVAYGIERTFLTNAFPTLTVTSPVTNIHATIATSGGEITNDGRTPILTRGITWNTTGNPTIALPSKTVDNSASGTGSFIAQMTGLTENTTYYVRAYASNAVGTSYGSQVLFSTQEVELPLIGTKPATLISSRSVTTGGNITYDGGIPVTKRGICWNTSPAPTADLPTNMVDLKAGAGNFDTVISGLLPGTTYYLRAYAINSKGTSYGQEETFSTLKELPVVSGVTIADITLVSVKAGAVVTADGGAALSAKGFVWNTTGNPTLSDQVLSSGPGIGSISEILTGLNSELTYFIKAFATNSEGTSYSANETIFTTKICPPTFTVSHVAGVNGAAATKTVTYNTVKTMISGSPRCWITQNLGADHEASAFNDATEASSGWYWQFNRLQAYKMDGVRTPATAWTFSIYENADWAPENDPCIQLLGTGWRLPTAVELKNIKKGPKTWVNDQDSYNSPLKLHNAGIFSYDSNFYYRGTHGFIWSGQQADPGKGTVMYYSSIINDVVSYEKAYAWSVRCISGQTVQMAPLVSNVTVPSASMKTDRVDAQADIIQDGAATITAKGFVWNNTGNPTLKDHVVSAGVGPGAISATLTGLDESLTYYVKAFATNIEGSNYSVEEMIFTTKICPPTFIISHLEGVNGAPVTKRVTYNTVKTTVSGQLKCWITQNLGADHEAVSVNDATEASAGWYWRFNQVQGYKMENTRIPATVWGWSIYDNSDWTAANDPCFQMLGQGWRVPTATELRNVKGSPQNWKNNQDAYNSPLKLHNAGLISYDGSFHYRGTQGYFWSGTQTSPTMGSVMYFNSTVVDLISLEKSYAWSVRCISDQLIRMEPVVTDVIVPSATIKIDRAEVQATVVADGGSTVTAKGLVWNTTGNPTLADQVISSGSGTGAIAGTLTGLNENLTYYVRAFATNSEGTGYSAKTFIFSTKICPATFTVSHIAGVNGAAVTKTVTYNAVKTMLSGEPKCWITQNLGADREALSSNDATEASAGWYWQFNRLQGYKMEGATRTPATAWNRTVNENSSWTVANDPCVQLLGGAWRLPVATELKNIMGSPQSWTSIKDGYNSALKIHTAGYISYTSEYFFLGTYGYLWSNTQESNTLGSVLYFSTGTGVTGLDKGYAMPVRCVSDRAVQMAPVVTDAIVPVSTIRADRAEVQASVMKDGGAAITAKGFVWNNTGNPTLKDHVVSAGTGLAAISATLTGLDESLTYYIKAFATNTEGSSYSVNETVFSTKICPPTFIISHVAGVNGAPVTKKVTYNTVKTAVSGELKCWITQNLGADQEAVSVTDATEASAGWYWRFNQLQGYKMESTRMPATVWGWVITENSDWTAANDPCLQMLGGGWRVPTSTELTKVKTSPQSWKNNQDAYKSPLKLHNAGMFSYDGNFFYRGTQGYFWSGNQTSNTMGSVLYFTSTAAEVIPLDKSYAWSVRCISDQVISSAPAVTDVIVPWETIKADRAEVQATVTADGGATVTAKGLVWNTTGNPTLADQVISSGSGIGAITGTLTGLNEALTYYVRAFATNSKGTGYSAKTISFSTKSCPASFTVSHIAGINGAAVSKTVTYNTVNSMLSGESKCWITQNLGADHEALSATDPSEASAGWYWQFNRLQGYKMEGTTRTPATAWNRTISENSSWTAANDPCIQLLGGGWRLPSATELKNVVGPPQSWTSIAGGFNSALKIHTAGYISYTSDFTSRGTYGYLWSNTQESNALASVLCFSTITGVTGLEKGYAFSARCLKD
ncbi:hypothetical protein [Pedobacter gandavensis]|uniref:hypothetical protein n=1 Tax=Pedobacter gandavensis TaxID=2679963 RepID=UPI00292CDE74|nr:hypothetical protein [Pedobacter gandavensis]